MKDHPYPAGEKFTSGTNVPYWIDSVEPLSYQSLSLDKRVDVVIVGGGLAGVSIAYNLSKAGKIVALVEDGFIGSGETGRTTAHLVTALDDRYYELEKLFGEEKTRTIAQSHATAIDFIEKTIAAEKINCDFERVNGYLFLHPTDDAASLDKELTAARRAGLDVEEAIIVLNNTQMRALRFANQAQFHPLKYIKALCAAIEKNGGTIYTNTHAKGIDHTGIVTNEGFIIRAKHIVVATNTPVNDEYAMHMKQIPYRTYVIALKVKKGLLAHALWWDTGDMGTNAETPPYHYVRAQKLNDEHDLLIVGGEDHPVARTEDKPEEHRYRLLEQWAREHFEGLGEIVYQWSGQVMEPVDSLAYIGRNPSDMDNVYIVTGDSGNGMTHGTIAGLLIRDLILGLENPWEKIYAPSRVNLIKTSKVILKELVGAVMHQLKARSSDHTKTSVHDLKTNEGRIIEFEGKKLGAYRDEHDDLHFVDTECTHRGCQVKWNNDEKSWDCPCHGSRFSYQGQVLNGPANEPLAYYSQVETHQPIQHTKL